MISIAVISQKGGVGKTTLMTAFAAYAAGAGQRAWVIDMDPLNASAFRWGEERANHHPEAQLSAVREVLSSLGVAEHPEVVVLNKADVADMAVVARMRHLVPGLVVVSAKTGEGFPDLLAAIDAALPQPPVAVDTLVPYERGDLLARVHAEGEVTFLEHTDTGTHIVAAVPEDLADSLTGVARASDVPGD